MNAWISRHDAERIDAALAEAYDVARSVNYLGTAVRLATARNLFREAAGLDDGLEDDTTDDWDEED